MFKEEQNRNIGAPTYRQALRKAMSVFLMAPFFTSRQSSVKNAGPGKAPSINPF